MEMASPDMAYDRTIVVFSPDGRLLQVEYAKEAVKRGSTSVGIKIKDGVILATEKIKFPLAVAQSYKIYKIDDHIGMVSSGIIADARDLAERARIRAQINKITYGEPISVFSLTKDLCDRKHLVTQYAGVRPYGVGLLVGGVDDTGPKLYETDPSGTMIEWNAQAIGKGADKAKDIFKKEWKENLSEEEGLKLVLKALKLGERGIEKEDIEIAVIKKERFKVLSPEEIKKIK